METREMLILRRRSGAESSSFGSATRNTTDEGGSTSANVPVSSRDGVEAFVADLAEGDVRDLRRDDDVIGAFEAMPLTLIEPDPAPAGTDFVVDGIAWGVRAVGAHESPFTGRGVTVAVLDTGIDATHPAFAGVQLVTRNFTAGGATDVTDTSGHGTHCAGTIFGRDVGGTRIGVAPGVGRALIGKVLGPGGGSTGTLFTAINWAIENGAQIVSMSLGVDLVGYRERLVARGVHPQQASSDVMHTLINNVRFLDKFGNTLRSGAAFGRGGLVLGASGNASNRFGLTPFILGAEYPSATEDFLPVAAVERTGDAARPWQVARFSNAGARFAGPGVDVVSAAPGGGLVPKNGTSQAGPHVAGVAALWAEKLMARGPVTAERLLDKLKESARRPAGLDEDDVGYGIPQAPPG